MLEITDYVVVRRVLKSLCNSYRLFSASIDHDVESLSCLLNLVAKRVVHHDHRNSHHEKEEDCENQVKRNEVKDVLLYGVWKTYEDESHHHNLTERSKTEL